MSMTDNGQPNPVFEGASASPTPAQIAAQQNAAGFHAGTTAAQQPQGQQVPFTGQQAPSGFSAEDIEKARNEERQKLYPQLQSVEQMKADLEDRRFNRSSPAEDSEHGRPATGDHGCAAPGDAWYYADRTGKRSIGESAGSTEVG
jgi:hypothetical protein